MSSGSKGKILVTGSNGFVGMPLCEELQKRNWKVRPTVRSGEDTQKRENIVISGPIDGKTDWKDCLQGIESVIHLAARVHVMKEEAADPMAEFLAINLNGTIKLAAQAVEAGVKRFIYLSTIKVLGESSNSAFTELDPPQPRDPYAISKYEAEEALKDLALKAGLEIVIIRPPLVYGPGVKANFFRLLEWVDRGLPFPFASLQNRRSLLGIDNLIDFICCCLEHPAAAGQTFLVSDGDDLSTPDLLKIIAQAMQKPLRLLPCPSTLLRLAGFLLGRSAEIDRLCGSLLLDTSKAREILEWRPPISVNQGIDRTVQWYAAHLNKAHV